ncbi:hypothetical protein SHIRM173S_06613 [Streptomyces hirsutus]
MSYLINRSHPSGPGHPSGPVLPVPPVAAGDSRPGAGVGARTGFGVPGLAHPLLAPAEWNALTCPGGASPLHWVVLNVADGPGVHPDPSCLEAVGRLRNAGVRILGRLDSAYGLRDVGELLSDAHRFIDWYRADGFLLDRCPADRAALPAVRRAVHALRVIRDDAHIVLGHGTPPSTQGVGLDEGENIEIIDVREPNEFEIVSIPGARLIPKNEFPMGSALESLPQDKKIVLNCKTGVRSAEVLAVLKSAGFADAVHVGGGVVGWVNQIEPAKPIY